MAKNYFQYVPNFDYINRHPNIKKIYNYVKTKNIFRRMKIREDIYENLVFFTKYRINNNDRPDNIAYKFYEDENLDWLVMLSNNMVNLQSEWPLPQSSFNEYLLNKYGSYEKLYNTHHYESQEIKDSEERIVLEKGLIVSQNYSVSFFDTGTELMVYKTNITDAIDNFTYEQRIQDQKTNIFLLKPQYIGIILDDIQSKMLYKEDSSQFIDFDLVRGDDIRIYS